MVFTREDAARAAQTIGIDFKKEAFQLEDLLNGMNTELARHGTKAGTVDVTHDDPTMTAKLAVANLRVSPSYYSQRVGKSAWERSLARGVKHKGAKTEYKTVEFELEGFDDTTYDEATTAKAGLMSAADKTKLDGMGATINKAIADHTATDAEVSEMLAEVYGE